MIIGVYFDTFRKPLFRNLTMGFTLVHRRPFSSLPFPYGNTVTEYTPHPVNPQYSEALYIYVGF